MNIFEIKIGTNLQLELDNNSDNLSEFYTSKLLDIINNETLLISVPMQASKIKLFPPYTKIIISFHNAYLGLANFSAEIIKTEKTNNLLACYVKNTSNIAISQRRNFYRLPAVLDVQFSFKTNIAELNYKNPDPIRNNLYKKGITINISGNGICFRTSEELANNILINLTLFISKEIIINSICKIIRVSRIETVSNYNYEISTTFVEISKEDEAKLIKYIYTKQRMLLRR